MKIYSIIPKPIYLLAFVLVLIFSNAYLYKSNIELKNVVMQKPIIQTVYATPTYMYNSSWSNIMPVPVCSGNICSVGGLSTNTEQNNLNDFPEKVYGCYYSKDNINEKINFTRGMSFTYYREGLIRYTQTNGNYELNQPEHTVTALPYDSSKIIFKVNSLSTNTSIISEAGIVFDKGSCATFNEY